MKACALDYADELRRSLDQDKPGWTVEMVRCPLHGGYHELVANPGQRPLSGGSDEAAGRRKPAQRFALLEGGLRCFHQSRAPALSGPCAHCGTTLHTHQDLLGRVKSGRLGKGYIEERCPACHRSNAVFPAYGVGGIRVMRVADGEAAMQMKLG